VGSGPPDPDQLNIIWAIKYDLSNHSHNLAMTVPRCFAFYDKKSRIPPDSHIFVCRAHAFRVGPDPPKLDCLTFFQAITYDLRNHIHRPSMAVPLFLCFTSKKLEFRPIPIYSYAITHAFRVGPGPPDPNRLKFLRAIKYDLRNHSHRLAMVVPRCFAIYDKKTSHPIRPIPIFSCDISHAFRVGPSARTSIA